MDNCCHVAKLSPSADNSVLNPQNWSCNVCGTTESVWACLSCSNVACGRYISEHALKHYEESGHPLALEVNDRYVFCYPCGDYVLNDNAAGDIQVLRSCLHTISTRGHVLPSEVGDGHKRLLRSCSVVSSNKSNFTFDDGYLVEKDRNFTALCFRRRCILAKAFNAWRRFTEQSQQKLKAGAANAEMEMPVEIEFEQRELPANVISLRSRQSRGPVLTPGLTGLRNLGNTCYMNSILQTLSHIREFREYFIKRSRQQAFSINGSGAAPRPRYSRQTTVECFEHVSSSGPVKDNQKGLIGGGLFAAIADMFGSDVATTATEYVSLSDELGALLRVMWSGKWAVISPHHILSSVWTALPFFRGYTQHDAQEFLSEFLDKIQSELASEVDSNDKMITDEKVECDSTKDIVAELFQGELVSQITCLKCGHCSRRREPFTDLSLDFPESYHATDGQHKSPCDENIHVHELLSLFTKAEKLDGPIYTCDACNVGVDKMHPVRTEATKQMLICRPPKILRLHLKRFMWGGRNSRGKISAHVDFNDVVDVSPFCLSDDSASEFTQNSQRGAGILYQLNGVVVHHGRGFGSGHYTAYCRNDLAGFWVNCNDSTVLVCERDDVHRTQAYILIYCQSPELAAVKCRSNSSSNSIKRARLDTGPYDLRSRPLLHIGIDD